MKKVSLYCIAYITLMMFFPGLAFARYTKFTLGKKIEDRDVRLDLKVISPELEEGSLPLPAAKPGEPETPPLVVPKGPGLLPPAPIKGLEEESLPLPAEEVIEPEIFLLPEIPVVEEEEIVEPRILEEPADIIQRDRETKVSKSQGYKLGPDDVIKVSVLRHPEFSGEFIIEPNGFISVPYIDPVKAEGMTKYQLKDKLTSVLSDFVKEPKVDVRIIGYNSQFIYIVGAVGRPGKYSTQGKKMTVRDAIVAAGMLTRNAFLRYAYIISPEADRKKQRVKLYDILYRGKSEDNLVLEPGSIVYVRSTVISKIGLFLDQLLNPVQRATAIKDIEDTY